MNDYQCLSDDERELLRDSTRGFLATHWPAEGAVKRAEQAAELRLIVKALAMQGFTELGRDLNGGGVQELLIILTELGRAGCPAPILDGFLCHRMLASNPADQASALLDGLAAGTAVAALGFGHLDGDRTAGRASLAGTALSGEIRYLEVPQAATHIVVALPDGCIGLVDALAEGVEIIPTRAFGSQGVGTVRFTSALVSALLHVSKAELADALRLHRLGLAARAHGAAERAFEMAVDYAKERKQFGRIIGSFQAIQHKLANCQVALAVVRHGLASAAAQFDQGQPEWRIQVAAVCIQANATLRHVSLETQHCFGAIGYAEEHEVPRHFKRVHQDVLRHGGGRVPREELAVHFLDEGKGFTEYNLGEQGNALRETIREWLKEHWTPERQSNLLASPHGQPFLPTLRADSLNFIHGWRYAER